MTKKEKIAYGIINAVIILYGVSLLFLYYKQITWVDGSVYESDLPAHIRMVVVDGWYYSVTALIYKLAFMTPAGNGIVVAFLAACSIASVYLTADLIKELSEKYLQMQSAGRKNMYSKGTFLLAGLLLNIVMPCYIKGMADGRYIGMQSASIWHNSTYIVMKMLALLCVLYYVKLADCYETELTWKKWAAFALLLVLCTAAKPSFLLVFAPMMAVILLVDLCKGVSFGKIVWFGFSVVPSLLVVLLQNAILFGGETGNGWELRPGYAMSLHSGHYIIAALLSVLFPVIVLAYTVIIASKSEPVKWYKDRWFLSAWIMALVGFLQLFLFSETGNRAADGNFMWGYSFAILMIFIVSWIRFDGTGTALKEGKLSGWITKLYVTGATLVLVYHLYCGLHFYIQLVKGVSYWMWN